MPQAKNCQTGCNMKRLLASCYQQ